MDASIGHPIIYFSTFFVVKPVLSGETKGQICDVAAIFHFFFFFFLQNKFFSLQELLLFTGVQLKLSNI